MQTERALADRDPRYVFSHQVNNFMDKAEANYTLTKSTLVYLCSGIFDEDLSQEQIEVNILEGKYRLHWFAFTQWIALTRTCLEQSKDLSAYPDMRELLCRVALELRNFRFRQEITSNDSLFHEIEAEFPEIVHIVCGVSQFRKEEDQTYWNMTNRKSYISFAFLPPFSSFPFLVLIILCATTGTQSIEYHFIEPDWIHKDPSIMSRLWARIYVGFSDLTCPKAAKHRKPACYCETLRRHYGTRLFKCSYPSCSLNRQGFDTSEACESHVKYENHSRAYKCSVQDCPYTVIGFSTSGDAYAHWEKRHQVPKSPPVHTIRTELSAEFQVLLFELTKAGDVQEIQRLVPVIAAHDWDVGPAVLLAAAMGSLPIVKVLTDWSTSGPLDSDLYKAIMRGQNPDMLLWFLNHRYCTMFKQDRDNYQRVAKEALATTSPDMYAVWESFFLDPDRGLRFAYPCFSEHNKLKSYQKQGRSIRSLCQSSILFSSMTIFAAKRSSLFEGRLIQTWHKLIDDVLGGEPLNRTLLGQALLGLARHYHPSVMLASELLRLGAPVDFPKVIDSHAAFSTVTSKSHLGKQHQEEIERPESETSKGLTILQIAARGTSLEAAQLVRLLLEHGAAPGYGWAGGPAMEPGVAVLQKWIGETWEELVERTAGARMEKMRRSTEICGDAYEIVDDDDEGEVEEGEDGEDDEEEQETRKGKGKAKEDTGDEGKGESSNQGTRKRRRTKY